VHEVTVATAGVPGTTTSDEGSPHGTARRSTLAAGILAAVLLLAVVAAVVLAMRVTAQSDAQAALLADHAVTKTYQELERQAALPAAQRSVDALERAIATPQSDTTASVWTTEVLSSNLSGDTPTARVATSITSAPDQPASSYLEFVAQVTPASARNVSSTVATCVIRSGSPSSPLGSSTVRFTPHMVLEPCSADLLHQLGITA
jgi:hypothetical protein